MTMRARVFRAAVVTLLATVLGSAPHLAQAGSDAALVEEMTITARPIDRFRIGYDDTRFGPFEFVGGLEMVSTGRDFGSLSAFRFTAPGSSFVGVADTGFWYFGTVTRDADGRPEGFADFRMVPFVDEAGTPVREKWYVDAEGLALRDGKAIVGFEREHRIAEFDLDPDHMAAATRTYDFLVPAYELRQNRGFETVTFAHPQGIHEGGMVVVSEKSLDRDGNIFAAILEGPDRGVFSVKRNGEFDITDGSFLPDGDLLLLERRYSMASGVAMRLRRIYGESIRAGALADGPVLMEADMGYQIDNMEGLDVWRRDDGALVVSLVSDDNHSILQRNLYLEFVLHDE